MNAKQTSMFAMCIITAELDTEGDPLILAKMPNFPNLLTELRNVIYRIKHVAERQEHFKAISALDKQSIRGNLETLMYNVASSFCDMATDLGELNNAEEWKLEPSDMTRMKDGKLLTTARNLITFAASRASDLVPYGITEDEVLALTKASDLFEVLTNNPKKNRDNKSLATRELAIAFAEAQKILKLMDNKVRAIRNHNPLFYEDYRRRRTVVKPPRRKVSVLGYVRDANTNILPGVKITIDGQTKASRTTKTGQFRIPNLPEGIYNLRANLPGYSELVYPLTVNYGETSRPVLELRAVAGQSSQ